jgi:hypothetical protein
VNSIFAMPNSAKVLPSIPHFITGHTSSVRSLGGKMYSYPQTAGQQLINFRANETGLAKTTKHAFSKYINFSL